MSTIPELDRFIAVYGQNAEIECVFLRESIDSEVSMEMMKAKASPGSQSPSQEEMEVFIIKKRTEDLTDYHATLSSALLKYQRGQYSAGDLFGVVNELMIQLTGFRMLIDSLSASVSVDQRVKMDALIIKEKERILKSGTYAVRDDFQPVWSHGAYTLEPV